MSMVDNNSPKDDGKVLHHDTMEKYNALNPVIINLTFEGEVHAGGNLISKKFTVKRVKVNEREAVEVTFVGAGTLQSCRVLIPLKFAEYLAPALTIVTEGIVSRSNDTNTNW